MFQRISATKQWQLAGLWLHRLNGGPNHFNSVGVTVTEGKFSHDCIFGVEMCGDDLVLALSLSRSSVVWRSRACNTRVLSLRCITSFCRLLSISDDNLFRDVSVVVQRRSWRVDYVYSLSYFSVVDVFYRDGFHWEVDWSVGLWPRCHAGVCRPSCAHAIDWMSVCEAIFSPMLCHSHILHVYIWRLWPSAQPLQSANYSQLIALRHRSRFSSSNALRRGSGRLDIRYQNFFGTERWASTVSRRH